MRTSVLLAVLVTFLIACKPSPDTFSLRSRNGQPVDGSARTATVGEGDVLVLDVTPMDSDKQMDLCVTATSSDSKTVEVRRVEGNCRLFVVSAAASGSATVTFSARDESQPLDVKVTPLVIP